MKRAGKRKHSSVASAESGPFSMVTETQTKRRRQSPCTSSTKNVKKEASVRDRRKLRQRSVQDPSTSREGRLPSGNTSAGYQCPICLESARNNEMNCLPCYHAFHQFCIDEWLRENRRCPVCRQETAPLQNTSQETALPQNARHSLNNQRLSISTRYQCPICLESTRNDEVKCLPCYHAFHPACIDQWLIEDRRCPVCRQEAAPPQNPRPSLNNQRQMIFGRLQALPRMTNVTNNVGRNNGGISMMLNDFFTRLTNYSMRLNNGGIVMRHNNGSSMILNNRGIEMRRNDGSSMILNNGGIEVRRNDGSSMILNTGGTRRNNINFYNS
ncbi:unnamed protein product [Larinioides sclopetarius]|uniref:RING-type domain-containing protein n=1 Tax=Larinioides sclopetarius TaxID=280406 RepID=A0AAV2AWH0_9ARAC